MREDITKWLEALRSGGYKQCEGTLHDANTGGFCCLGVYAVVAGISTPEQMGRVYDEEMGLGDEGPEAVYQKIREAVDQLVVEQGIFMNDDGNPFSLIADMIEEHYKND